MTQELEVLEHVNLAPLTSLGVGGPARYFVDASTEEQLLLALDWAARQRVPFWLLGGGSNVVVSDAGLNGLVVRVAARGTSVEKHPHFAHFSAAAGEPWDGVVSQAVARGLAGIECMSGVPGLVGATPIQNVGAYGQEVSDTIVSVRAFDRESSSVVQLSKQDCRFAYRSSWFKAGARGRFLILGVTYQLDTAGRPNVGYRDLALALEAAGISKPTLADVRAAVLEVRRSKSMLLDPADPDARSCGSFFMNPLVTSAELEQVRARAGMDDLPSYPQSDGRVKLSAAWLIERAGLRKGERLGSAAISSRHSLALVCRSDCRASDVVALARRIRSEVQRAFGVHLYPEPEFWGFASMDAGLPDERLA